MDQLSASAVSGFREPAKPPLKTQDNFYKSKAAALGAGSMPYQERGKNTDARQRANSMNLTTGFQAKHDSAAASVQLNPDEGEHTSVRPSQVGNRVALDSAGLAHYDVQSLGDGYYPHAA